MLLRQKLRRVGKGATRFSACAVPTRMGARGHGTLYLRVARLVRVDRAFAHPTETLLTR